MTDQTMAPDNGGPPQGEQPVMSEVPTVNRVTLESGMAEIKEAVNESLDAFGGSARTAQAQMSAFLSQIQPDVEQALAEADVMSLSYLRDQIIMRAGRVSLGLIHQQRMMVANTVVTVLRILIKVGIGAVVPVPLPIG